MLKYLLCGFGIIVTMMHLPGRWGSHVSGEPKASAYSDTGRQVTWYISGLAQGTTFLVKYVHKDSIIAKTEIDSIFKKIDSSLSLYLSVSLINRFNKTGRVRMDEHLRKVVEKSLEVNHVSCGAFDITVKPLVDLWGFGVKPGGHDPGQKKISKALSHTGSGLLFIRHDSLIRKDNSVQIDCNGIAQGYTVDVISGYLQGKGIFDFIVEVGGEVRAIGKHGEGGDWKVGIESPELIAGDWHATNRIIKLQNSAVTTSGSYRKYFVDKGGLHGHVIDPKTGRPVANGVISVSVLAHDAMTADAWDNGFFVMGVGHSFAWLNKHPGMGLYMIYTDDAGTIRDTANALFSSVMYGN